MMRRATHPVRSVQCLVASARGTAVTAVEFLALTSQANPTQCGQATQPGRFWYVSELIAIGIGKGCQPSLRAAANSMSASVFKGSGGIGYGLLRGGSKEFAPALPETPISHSALV